MYMCVCRVINKINKESLRVSRRHLGKAHRLVPSIYLYQGISITQLPAPLLTHFLLRSIRPPDN